MLGNAQIEKVNCAVVGLGWWGKVIVKTVLKSTKIRIAAVTDVAPAAEEWAKQQGLQFRSSFDEILNDRAIDAVILCTPHSRHTEQVVKAAAARKNVFCEKPLALTLADARRSVEACQANNVVLGVGHELRFTPPMIALREKLREGEFGTLVQTEATFTGLVAHAAGNWRLAQDEAPGGPPMTGKGIHALDLCIGIHGGAERVCASLQQTGPDARSGDTLAVLLTFKTGANGLITALWSSPFSNRITVFGTNGWAEIRDKAHPEKAAGWTFTTCMRDEKLTVVEYGPISPVLKNLEAFAEAVSNRSLYPISGEEMLATAAALEAIGKSAIGTTVVRVSS